ncbi:MAG: alpha/beta hydrolase [Bacteroidetes bacterium]|nr:alpha/beta hydrolase [Bacteroidota bacterium]
MPDSIKLRGWMAIDTTKMISPLLLIIPDMLEGAIDYIPAMQEFSARGFNVGVINLRGQGNSDGEYYLPGQKSIDDLIRIIPELRALPYVNHVAILGSGSGAGIAIFTIKRHCYCRCINLTKSSF